MPLEQLLLNRCVTFQFPVSETCSSDEREGSSPCPVLEEWERGMTSLNFISSWVVAASESDSPRDNDVLFCFGGSQSRDWGLLRRYFRQTQHFAPRESSSERSEHYTRKCSTSKRVIVGVLVGKDHCSFRVTYFITSTVSHQSFFLKRKQTQAWSICYFYPILGLHKFDKLMPIFCQMLWSWLDFIHLNV